MYTIITFEAFFDVDVRLRYSNKDSGNYDPILILACVTRLPKIQTPAQQFVGSLK